MRDNVVLVRLKRKVVPQNLVATLVPQIVVATEDEDELYHGIEASICNAIVNVKSSQHRIGVTSIVNVNVASNGAVGRRHCKSIMKAVTRVLRRAKKNQKKKPILLRRGMHYSSVQRSEVHLSGRWTVSDYSRKYYAACRAIGQPYN